MFAFTAAPAAANDLIQQQISSQANDSPMQEFSPDTHKLAVIKADDELLSAFRKETIS